MMGMRFFIVGGVILIASGLLQLLMRPRKAGEHRVLNRGTIWAGFCMLVGLFAILLGAGALPFGPR
jgi:hypothetical protein